MPRHQPNLLFNPHGSSIFFQGAPPEEGPKPALIYFALSGQTTLFEDPFNQPVEHLIKEGIRVFSWDLPFHSLEIDPNESMRRWISEYEKQPSFMIEFLELCRANLHYLVAQHLIEPRFIAVAGLSRGGYIAVQFAACEPLIKTIVCFSPLTRHFGLDSNQNSERRQFQEQTDLDALADQLISKHLRFYIGNRDTRVGTDHCYSFIRTLTETAYNKGVRSPSVEFIIYPSIGFKGHGTPPAIFHEGAEWIKKKLKTEIHRV